MRIDVDPGSNKQTACQESSLKDYNDNHWNFRWIERVLLERREAGAFIILMKSFYTPLGSFEITDWYFMAS
jgi:hypothetical protein